MSCPSLAELPPPPAHKTGWPWTLDSVRLPVRDDAGRPWPRITIVMPSFNQGEFIEESIRSVLLQGYPNLEYFVLDGGSTDNSVEVIEKYSKWIDFWVSERDSGQSAAINRGLRMGTGSCATWINSDDALCKDALHRHFSNHKVADDTVYVGDCVNMDAAGNVLFVHRGRIRSFEELVRVRSIWNSDGYICQQEVLFPLSLALRVGALREDNHYSMDFEFWGELLLAGARFEYTGIPFGAFRLHEAQKTRQIRKQIESTIDAAEALTARADMLPPVTRQEIVADLRAYRGELPGILWRQTGRLARLGLPPSIVMWMRNLRQILEKTTR